jgi:hypothetical protein
VIDPPEVQLARSHPTEETCHARLGSGQSTTNFGTATTLLADANDGGSIMHTYI